MIPSPVNTFIHCHLHPASHMHQVFPSYDQHTVVCITFYTHFWIFIKNLQKGIMVMGQILSDERECRVVWHGNVRMHIWRPQASSSVPLDRDQKCNSGHLSLQHYFSMVSLTIWMDRDSRNDVMEIDKGIRFEYSNNFILLSASPEDTSLLALRSIQIWLFSFNSFYDQIFLPSFIQSIYDLFTIILHHVNISYNHSMMFMEKMEKQLWHCIAEIWSCLHWNYILISLLYFHEKKTRKWGKWFY